MRKILILVLVIAILTAIFSSKSKDSEPEVGGNLERYENGALGYSFQYPGGPDGYVIQDLPAQAANYPNLEEGLMLMLNADYQSILRGEREGGEGPPTINIYVFSNPENLALRDWLEANSQISNVNLVIGEVSSTSLAGVNALSYEADGLYASRNIVAQEGARIYFLSGSFIDRNSEIYRDFSTILESFEFVS